ncbi:helix-turn-helix domain-containing protein [Clostridium butyricum]|jgi:transcriptional regulator with XRE-family HTH domain|uniref:helix-turn-helix domain-containing protein n=1 Tax=Clostridium TaxID=1485 RepID=UPI002902EB6E|nr:helix-turn-helix transcriptional regulator [Clostridium sp.]MDU1004463.1 helix-turn-helix transcriptional regulator [Clostridium butyricum]MDU1229875.1 helix-turn-helix transcriptional regulator [Clostridium sp.]MDU5723453.1 helix-turn-helix transcriptional regulator [Clostridium butyricum]MDU5820674.1 helix-turn-helix transcriptional regulator [Clostridium butyricum]
MGLKENLKRRRLELNLTLEEVSKRLSISKPTLQRYESGVISNIPSDKIEKLAEILDTTPSVLMGWNIENDNDKPLNMILTDEEKLLLYKFNTLDDMGKHTVQSILTLEYNRCK